MLDLLGIPTEILGRIATSIRADKDDYGAEATTSLRNLRMTCRRLNVISIPILFENWVFDEKFLASEQLARLSRFNLEVPYLAAYVKRLQYKMSPVQIHWGRADSVIHLTKEFLKASCPYIDFKNLADRDRFLHFLDVEFLDDIREWLMRMRDFVGWIYVRRHTHRR